ncbi:MAG TPA: hypothetical protein VF665_02360 [Longimicrobium sp.]|jgi:hypothetical protein|uniref:hypothetical protein n=1 Tax=Longimicrobium sp. TaxID=2029185 RepID=UPI002ED9EA82
MGTNSVPAPPPPGVSPRPDRTASRPGGPLRDKTIAGLVAAELPGQDVRAGDNGQWLQHPPRDLIGLALSGGGIRSATFNLGLLQGLHEMRLLRSFDYLSTVSGGGYLGAWWTAWRSRGPRRGGDFPSHVPPGCAEPEEVRHLREFSNFLTPRLGIFSYDTGRMVVNAVSSMVPSILAALSVIALGLLAWVGLSGLMLSGRTGAYAPVFTLLGVTLVALAGFEAVWRRRKEDPDGIQYLASSLLALAFTAAAWWLVGSRLNAMGVYRPGQVLPGFHDSRPDEAWYVLAPAAAWGTALLGFIALRWFFSGTLRLSYAQRVHRTADRVRSRLLFLTVAWAVVPALWMSGVILAHFLAGHSRGWTGGLTGLTAALAGLFAKVQQFLAKQSKGTDGSGKLRDRLKPMLPQLLAYSVVVLAIVGVAAGIVTVERLASTRSVFALQPVAVIAVAGMALASPVWIALGAALVTLLVLALMNPNEVGFHSFYRARLARAYSGASNNERLDAQGHRRTNREAEELLGDDIRLDKLEDGALRPFHLVCLAANDLSSRDDMANLSRGADSAVLSHAGFSVGSRWAPWSEFRKPVSLAAAITASGAAFNTLMGSRSKEYGPAVAFLMAALNLRLGMWVAHPDNPRKKKLRVAPGAPFYSEMFGNASSTGNQVHLSDGAHFENLAAYELVRRHCRVIVVSDCGQDGDSAFDDLGNLVRRVREDFGVDIRIDTRPVRPGADGLSSQYMVAGDIHYPDGDTGVLLFFKPALIGGEPADVTQYRTRNAAFPHESTLDQFYDEAQWESYRRLGQHAARNAFLTVLDGLKLEEPEQTDETLRPVWMEAFARARREWFPEPEGWDERLSHFADRVAELESALRGPGSELLLRQVYKELDELDQQQRMRFPVPVVAEDGQGGAVQVSAGAPADRFPSAESQEAALHLIRRALLVMEEVFESEDLDRNHNHPMYLGLMNWFARWAYAPLFRTWWPLLKTLYPQRYTRFLETHFSLGSLDHDPRSQERRFTWIDQGRNGFAWSCWVRQGNDPQPKGRQVVSYNLRMVYRNEDPYAIQAAQVVAARRDGTLAWDAEHFFVPAGLWGVGIGSDFLKQLRRPSPKLQDVTHLAVRVEAKKTKGTPAKRWAANELQLYRTAGFQKAYMVEGDLIFAGRRIPVPHDFAAQDDGAAQWMVAEVDLSEQADGDAVLAGAAAQGGGGDEAPPAGDDGQKPPA